jgi:dihydrofolate reductase
MVSIIVATARGGVIGKTGTIPWYLPADLAHFKQVTMGHPIIMGRVTHESIGKALPGRQNIVITSNPNYSAEDCEVVRSLEEALELTKSESEVLIIGGESIYEQALPLTNKIYITSIDAEFMGDKYFRYDSKNWAETEREAHAPDDKNPYPYTFTTLTRT